MNETTVDVDYKVVEEFNKLYYHTADTTWNSLYWRGHKLFKYPTDLVMYSEIIWELRPDLIIETGTFMGGSAMFMADVMDSMHLPEHHRIWTIDIQPALTPKHPRIQYLIGSSTDDSIIEMVKERASKAKTVLVILDSDHRKSHVYAEMRLYSPLVTPGSYLIVEDTAINGHPVLPDFGPGPWEAVSQFLASQMGNDFHPDTWKERLLLTANPRGFLKKREVPSSPYATPPKTPLSTS